MTWVAVLLAAIVGAILANATSPDGVTVAAQTLETYRYRTSAGRLSLVAICMVLWPTAIRYCQARYGLSPASAIRLRNSRWRIAAWCVGIELVIGWEVFNALFGALRMPST